MSESLLGRALKFALARMKEADESILSLPLPLQTIIVVEAAQSIIDNGGLEYFYESNFVGTPDYGVFVSAYRRIGAEAAATCIAATAAMFPFDDPHLHETKRSRWLGHVRGNERHPFGQLSQKAASDETVFPKLEQYIEANREAFGLS